MSLPGQRSLPGQGWKPPRKRRAAKLRTFVASCAVVLELPLPTKHVVDLLCGVVTAAGRPQRADHPMSIAAWRGRSSNLNAPPPADITDPSEVRAYEVARDRARAARWGWRSEYSARMAGRDNRSARRRR